MPFGPVARKIRGDQALKILHVIAPAPMGGAESAVRSLVVGSRAAGYDVEVAVLLTPDGQPAFVDGLRSEGVPVHEIRQHLRNYPAQIRDLAELIRAEQVDLLHSHVYHADAVAMFAVRRAKIPWVATVHGQGDGDLKYRTYMWLNMRMLRRADGVVCVAESVRDKVFATGMKPGTAHVIPNGYVPVPTVSREEARATLGIEASTPTIGWIGRLSAEKGADLLLDALAAPESEDVSAVVIGDGGEREALEDQARELGLHGSRVHFAGRVDDAARLIAAFDSVVISSRTEGTPMVLLEAMAAGVPVATFGVGGIPDMVDQESAFVVEPLDVPGMARAIAQSVLPANARPRAARAAEIFDARYSARTCVDQTIELYRALLGDASSRGAETAAPTPDSAERNSPE